MRVTPGVCVFCLVPLLKLAQVRWIGHATRMPDEQLPKKIFCGELQVVNRSQGGQKNVTRISLKPPFTTSIYPRSPGKILHMVGQSGAASEKRSR